MRMYNKIHTLMDEIGRCLCRYSNGEICIFDYMNGTHVHTYRGHRTMCVCLCFDANGSRLASGGADNDIILWDNVAHTGLMR
jgi:U3 small nucleolar RNA-associated protein 12